MGVLATHVSSCISNDSSSTTRRQRRAAEEDSSFGEVVVLNHSFVVPRSPLRTSRKVLSLANKAATAAPLHQGSSSTRTAPRPPQRQESDHSWLNIEDGPEPWTPRRQSQLLSQQLNKSCLKSPKAYPFPPDLQASSRHNRKTLISFLREEEQRNETQSLPCRNVLDTATFISGRPPPPPLMYSPASSSSSSVSSRKGSDSESKASSGKSRSSTHSRSTHTTRSSTSSSSSRHGSRHSHPSTSMSSPVPRDSTSRTRSRNPSPSSHTQSPQVMVMDKEMSAFPKAAITAKASPQQESLISLLQDGATATAPPTSRDMPHWIRRRLETKLRQDEIAARMAAAAASGTCLFAAPPLHSS